jgi:D-sedoheptulose 7-phosphate isomerase
MQMAETASKTDTFVHGALSDLSAVAKLAAQGDFVRQISHAADVIVASLKAGNKVLTCGNGGSAADAAHLAEELLGRYKKSRNPMPAMCLCTDGPALTCIANDFGFENVFARQVQALGKAGDVLVAFTTSGKSENINRALKAGRVGGLTTIAVTGRVGGASAELAENVVAVPSDDSARVQEMHTFVLHAICDACEREVG